MGTSNTPHIYKHHNTQPQHSRLIHDQDQYQLHEANSPQKETNLPPPTPRTILLSLAILLMAFTMPGFLNRLIRPFSASTSLGLGESALITSPEGAQLATIAAGCFWGVEHMFRKEFKGKGLYDARVGYIGGDMKSPSYRAVCSGSTGRMYTFLFSFCHMKLGFWIGTHD